MSHIIPTMVDMIPKRIHFLILVLLLSSTNAATAFTINSYPNPTPPAHIWYVGGSGPGNYTTVQAAIDNASSGDTIIVYPGTYRESLRLIKSLTLRGINRPGLHSHGNATLTILADECTLQNFNLYGGDKQTAVQCFSSYNTITDCAFFHTDLELLLKNASHNSIIDNRFFGNGSGIRLTNASSNTLCNNSITGHYWQLRIEVSSQHNRIEQNTISDSIIYEGIIIGANCSWNQICNNTIASNNYGGILVSGGEYLTIVNNTFLENSLVFEVPSPLIETYTIQGNTINGRPLYIGINLNGGSVPENAGQIQLYNCTNVRIQNCTPTESSPGILIVNCSRITITRNTLVYTDVSDQPRYGFRADNSDTLIIDNNTLAYAGYLIIIGHSTNVTIIRNILQNAEYDGVEIWYSPGAVITKNILINISDNAIDNWFSDTCHIANNTIRNSGDGITLTNVRGCTLASNLIVNSTYKGIVCYLGRLSTISGNTILGSGSGVYLSDSVLVTITGNNFICNKVNAFFVNSLSCRWSRNYWNRHIGIGPKIVAGTIVIVIEPQVSHEPYRYIILPVLRLDKLPAHTPYPYTENL